MAKKKKQKQNTKYKIDAVFLLLVMIVIVLFRTDMIQLFWADVHGFFLIFDIHTCVPGL